MTTLREAAQQALEALEDMLGWQSLAPQTIQESAKGRAAALRAALVEDAMQKFTDVNQELMAALGCDHCNHPLYAAIKCRVCGRVTPIIEPKIKRDNKPVAWIHTDPDKPRVRFLEWRENEPGYRGDWIKTPLYAAPPQHKPLSDADLAKIWDDALDQLDQRDQLRFIARAIERAHGIGGQP